MNGFKAITGVQDAGSIVLGVAGCDPEGRPACVLCVENNGPSIPEDELERLFDPFHTGDEEDGTGLGLAIAARIADQHGGVLDVENAGLGVRFRLTLEGL